MTIEALVSGQPVAGFGWCPFLRGAETARKAGGGACGHGFGSRLVCPTCCHFEAVREFERMEAELLDVAVADDAGADLMVVGALSLAG
jgi:hypothetical protein